MKRILALALTASFPVIAIAAQPATPQVAATPAPAAVVAAPAAPVVPPPTQASLDKLVEVAGVSLIHDSIAKTLDQSAERVSMFTTARLRGITLTPAEKASVDSLPGQLKAIIDAGFSADTVKDIFAKEYGKKFDQKEVDGLIAFYSSPVGQEFAAKQLEINTEVTVQLQGAIRGLGAQVQKTISAVVSPIMKAHEPKPVAKPAGAKGAAATPGILHPIIHPIIWPAAAKPTTTPAAASTTTPAATSTTTPASTAASH